MIAPPIALAGVTKVFPMPFRRSGVVAVRDLNLRVDAGQIYGLLGPNGSGKSTTLKIILGLISPTRGTAEIFGRDSSLVASRAAVGFLPERPYFYRHLTAAETLRFYGKLAQVRGRALEERVTELLELVGLTSARDRRLSTFSKGMLQRIGVAQALVHDPQLLLLDEPTAGVDPAGSRDMRELLLTLKSRGKTILLSSHLLGQVQEVCDRVGILVEGVLVREGALSELLAIEDQTEIILEQAAPPLLDAIVALAEKSGARVVVQRPPQATLERVFLECTSPRK
ncbi:MAG TPA: ABC transporter ATP-binding protein [Chthoniobacterales bacterium]|nr:ABC transporter ATP-binding protein [Chthoniobacterales bacterium]